MKGVVIAIISILVVIAIAIAVYYQPSMPKVLSAAASDSVLNARFSTVNITEHNGNSSAVWSAYLAVTTAQLEEGYMNVSTIGNCNNMGSCIGMLFLFQNQSSQCFWMENTAIPLRQTWLNRSGYPTYTYVGAPYSTQAICSYGKYVIETAPNVSINGYITLNSS